MTQDNWGRGITVETHWRSMSTRNFCNGFCVYGTFNELAGNGLKKESAPSFQYPDLFHNRLLNLFIEQESYGMPKGKWRGMRKRGKCQPPPNPGTWILRTHPSPKEKIKENSRNIPGDNLRKNQSGNNRIIPGISPRQVKKGSLLFYPSLSGICDRFPT